MQKRLLHISKWTFVVATILVSLTLIVFGVVYLINAVITSDPTGVFGVLFSFFGILMLSLLMRSFRSLTGKGDSADSKENFQSQESQR